MSAEKTIIKYSFLLCLLFYVLFMLITPPFQVLDEGMHFLRAYQVSEGTFIPEKRGEMTGGELPKSLLSFHSAMRTGKIAWNPLEKFEPIWLKQQLNERLEPTERQYLSFPNTSNYSPVNYIPQSLGILLGRFLSQPPITIFYLGRIAAALFFLSVLFAATKYLPTFKYGLICIMLWPMLVFSMPSFSADTMNILLSFLVFILFVSSCEKLSILESDTIKRYDWILILICFGLLLLCKAVYAVYGLPVVYYLWLKGRKIPSSQCFVFWFVSVLFLCIFGALSVYWNQLVISQFNSLRPEHVLPGQTIDPVQQKAYILKNPLDFVIFVYHDFFNGIMVKKYFTTAVGMHLGWGYVDLNRFVVYGVVLVTLAAALFDKPFSFPHQWLLRCCSLLLFLVGVGMVNSAMYLTWNSVGSSEMVGIHGRYYLPFMPLLIWPFCGLFYSLANRYPLLGKIPSFIPLGIAPLWLIYAWLLVIQRYY